MRVETNFMIEVQDDLGIWDKIEWPEFYTKEHLSFWQKLADSLKRVKTLPSTFKLYKGMGFNDYSKWSCFIECFSSFSDDKGIKVYKISGRDVILKDNFTMEGSFSKISSYGIKFNELGLSTQKSIKRENDGRETTVYVCTIDVLEAKLAASGENLIGSMKDAVNRRVLNKILLTVNEMAGKTSSECADDEYYSESDTEEINWEELHKHESLVLLYNKVYEILTDQYDMYNFSNVRLIFYKFY